jgi:NADH dehydrogenase (ubiquinone) 1 beta subcomplex subunit 5
LRLVFAPAGKPELREIPEGYEPKYWEYYRHPIERKFAKWFHYAPEQMYEVHLHHVKCQQDVARMK